MAISKLAASLALVMAVLAFAFGSAPFTPALALAAVAIPLASITLLLGVRRLSIVTLYWAIAALLSIPLSKLLPVSVDNILVTLAVIGFAVSSALLVHYVGSKSAADEFQFWRPK